MKNILFKTVLGVGLCGALAPSCMPERAPSQDDRVGNVSQALGAVDVCYPGGTVAPNVTFSGTAVGAGDSVELTASSGFQRGAVYFNTPLSAAKDLHAAFKLRTSENQFGGGTGMAFVLQNAAEGPKAFPASIDFEVLGCGYDSISPALAVEFDTFGNSGDPNGNHVALTFGSENHSSGVNEFAPVPVTPPFDLLTAEAVYAWVDYSVATQTLKVYVADTNAKPAMPLISGSEIDLATKVGSTFFAGFTGMTEQNGASADPRVSRQQVLSFSITDHLADATSACCTTNADCKDAAASICDTGKHVCGACSLDDVSKCGAGKGCDVSDGAGKCVTACTKDEDCTSPDFPSCSLTGATKGSCVACDGDFESAGTHACAAAAPVCKSNGYCHARNINGTACTADSDCVSNSCIDGVCCNTPCGFNDPTDCLACSKAAGSSKDGKCEPRAVDSLCDTDANVCSTQTCTEGGTCGTPSGTNDCSMHGTCGPILGCACEDGFAGSSCQYSDATDCSGHGKAQPDGSCACLPKFTGEKCEKCADNYYGEACETFCNAAACPVPEKGCFTSSCSETGECVYTAVKSGQSCDDGSACTKDDVCQMGVCKGGSAPTCQAKDQCHVAGECNPKTGGCSEPTKPEGTMCKAEGDKDGTCVTGTCEEVPVTSTKTDDGFTAQGGFSCHLAGNAPASSGSRFGFAALLGAVLAAGARRRRKAALVAAVAASMTAVGCTERETSLATTTTTTSTSSTTSSTASTGSGMMMGCDDGNPCTVDTDNGDGTCKHVAGNAGTSCREAAGACDVAETCDGTSEACPADALKSAETECRKAEGDCDMAETCTGKTAACPADTAALKGTSCRKAVGLCDAPEACDGTAKECPKDELVPEGKICRPTAKPCDMAETCDGKVVTCPEDSGVGTPELFAAKGSAPGPTGTGLFKIDPKTAAATPVGDLKLSLTGMAQDPTSGVVYAVVSYKSPSLGGNLIALDTKTAKYKAIGPTNSGIADLAFDTSGKLYCWTESGDKPCTVNKNTGEVTYGTKQDVSSWGDALAFSLDGELFLSRGDGAFLVKVDLLTLDGAELAYKAIPDAVDSCGGYSAQSAGTVHPITGEMYISRIDYCKQKPLPTDLIAYTITKDADWPGKVIGALPTGIDALEFVCNYKK